MTPSTPLNTPPFPPRLKAHSDPSKERCTVLPNPTPPCPGTLEQLDPLEPLWLELTERFVGQTGRVPENFADLFATLHATDVDTERQLEVVLASRDLPALEQSWKRKIKGYTR